MGLRHGLEAGACHGLEDRLGLRHGLEAWGREGWLGLSNGKKRYSVRLEHKSRKTFQKSLISSLRSEMRDLLRFVSRFFTKGP